MRTKQRTKFVPGHHTVKEFEPWGIAKVEVCGRWVTIYTNSAYDKNYELITRGVKIKIRSNHEPSH